MTLAVNLSRLKKEVKSAKKAKYAKNQMGGYSVGTNHAIVLRINLFVPKGYKGTRLVDCSVKKTDCVSMESVCLYFSIDGLACTDRLDGI